MILESNLRLLSREAREAGVVRSRVKSTSLNLRLGVVCPFVSAAEEEYNPPVAIFIVHGLLTMSPPAKEFRHSLRPSLRELGARNQYLSHSDKCHWVLEHFLLSRGFRQSSGPTKTVSFVGRGRQDCSHIRDRGKRPAVNNVLLFWGERRGEEFERKAPVKLYGGENRLIYSEFHGEILEETPFKIRRR